MSFPAFIAPQLATLVDGAPRDEGAWSFEMKLDGYRIVARCDRADVRLFSRNAKDWTSRLPAIAAALAKMNLPQTWIDGEVVVLRESGAPSFQLLQNAFDHGNTARILYYAFDLPFHKGDDLRELPLEKRRARLARVMARRKGLVRYSEDFDAPVSTLFASACRLQLEGLIGKRRDAPYSSGRTKSWIKLKCKARQEFVIGGHTEPQGSRTGFGALLLGVNEGGKLRYAGRVGTGFDEKRLTEMHAKLRRIEAPSPAFANPPRGADARGVHWVRPKLVGEVEFAEWTDEGVVRHAAFLGLRDDKPARAIRRERAA